MTVLQLVSCDRPEGQRELSIVPNPSEKHPDSFEHPPTHPALIGSKDLTSLAAGLCHEGYRVIETKLVDRFFQHLDDPESEEIAEHLAALLNRQNMPAILDYLKRELNGCFVGSVRLRDATKKGTVVLQQEGIVITSPNVKPDELNKNVRSAAKWARVS